MAEKAMDGIISRLEDPVSDIISKVAAITEVRDNIETWFQNGYYARFLPKFISLLLGLLDGEPKFLSVSPEQRLRHTVLEIFHRLPMTPPEPLEPYAASIVDKLLALLKIDNEENAILCIKIFMDIQRHQPRPLLGDRVQGFLSVIQEMFESMPQVVKETFSSPGPASTQGSSTSGTEFHHSNSPRPGSPVVQSADASSEQQQARLLPKGVRSFKTLAECPIAVVSIFQVYKDLVHNNVRLFVPLIKEILILQAGPQEQAHTEASLQNTIFTGVSKNISNRAAFADFITAQVKTMSFLAYVLRTYGQLLQDFLPHLPSIVVRLLKDCPKEKCSVRKELLVAIRHIVNFNFRKIFLKVIDDLLNERVLLGDGLAVYETQRPLAYSLLADLIHHLREALSPDQIRAAVRVYTRNLRDPFPGTSFQTMSAKLLLNMAEYIAKLDDKQEARYHLIAILDAIGDKFAFMNRQYHNAVKVSSRYDPHAPEVSSIDYLATKEHPPDWDNVDIFTLTPVKTANPRDRGVDPVTDNKFLFRTLVHGLKGLFYQLRNCNPPALVDAVNAPPNWHEVASGFSAEEVNVLIKLFHEGIGVFQYYPAEKPPNDSQSSPVEVLASHHVVYNKEEKELLETFATVFHHIDPATFHEIFHSEIPHMYEMMFNHPALLQVPQFLLASEATSPSFAGMLLQFLMSKIEDIGSADINRATILLRLFKLSFMAVTLFSKHNEQVLLPHVNKLVTKSIKLSTLAESPMHYFYLLRSLFRSIGGGRFEELYKEILPLLEMLLEVLNNLISAARKPQERELFVELSLTVPARLSNLLPHLTYLMKPLVLALRAGSELVGQGLRTLELCVDNLTADYLDPIMAPVIDDLMAALWEHLKPSPYSHFHAHTTMRILGKLGGRNRKFLEGPPTLDYESYADRPPRLDIKLVGSFGHSAFPAFIGHKVAILKLHEIPRSASSKATDLFHKQQALRMIISQIKLLITSDTIPEDFSQQVRLQARTLYEDVDGRNLISDTPLERGRSVVKKNAQQEILKELLKGCLFAVSITALSQEATNFMADLCRHFALLEVGVAISECRQDQKSFHVDFGEPRLALDHRVIIDAILESLSSENAEVRSAAELAIMQLRDGANTILQSAEKTRKLPIFTRLVTLSCHNCHQPEWFTKAGGILGLQILAAKLYPGSSWLAERQIEICRALIYAAKDLPEDLPNVTRSRALETLAVMIRCCNTSATREEVLNSSHKLNNLCNFLIFELSSTSEHVRVASQDALSLLAELTSMGIDEIVRGTKQRLLSHIFLKPLRTVTIPIQIGYIEALAFCLNLGNNILEVNDQLLRFLREAITLADQEEEKLTKSPVDQRNSENVVRLRVSCLRLLSLALSIPEFSNSPANKGRSKIISVFFRALYNKSADVVDAANEALKVVVAHDPKLPKDILQVGLRPILVSLQEPSKLRVDGLQCLARLLQLLKNYFKVEIGTRLLDNIGQIVDAVILQKASFTLVEQHERLSIVAAIFNVFHLLPDAAKDFMGSIVSKVVELEHQLRRTHFSPLRAPVIKYLNRYPNEAWELFFSKQLSDQAQGRFFAQVVAEVNSKPLRDAITSNINGFTTVLNSDSSDTAHWTAIINTIQIIDAVCRFDDSQNTLLLDSDIKWGLFSAGKTLENQLQGSDIDPTLRLGARQAGERLLRIFTRYMSSHLNDLDFFFEFIKDITSRQVQDVSGVLQNFLYDHIICSTDQDYWRSIFYRSIDIYTARSAPESLKTFVMRYIVTPILAKDVMRNWDHLFGEMKGTKFVNRALVDMFVAKLWVPQSKIDPMDDNTLTGIDHSRMELLQTTTLLLKYYTSIVADVRREVIRFGWTYLRLEDLVNKHASYVVLAYFISSYNSPAKIASQVYHSLIRAYSAEARPLVMQALEVLAPVIPQRMGNFDGRSQTWIRLARKPIAEDPSNMMQLQNILYFVARHPDLFEEGKEGFSQIIIHSLHKIAPLPSTSLENKKAALNLITLIVTWEQEHVRRNDVVTDSQTSTPAKKRALDSSGTDHEKGVISITKSFIPSTSLRFALLKYLVQFVASLTDRFPGSASKVKETNMSQVSQSAQPTDICKRALSLFQRLLLYPYWTDIDIDAMFPKVTEHVLSTEPKQDEKYELAITRIINTLQLVSVMINVKSDEWIVARVPQLRRMLEKPVRNLHPEVQNCLYKSYEDKGMPAHRRPLILKILEAIPYENNEEETEDADAPTTEFVTFLSTVAAESLSSNNHLTGLNLLLVFSSCRPQIIDQHITQVMKALSSLLKDHIAAPGTNQVNSQAIRSLDGHGAQTDANTNELQITLLHKIIDLLASRMAHLGDNRRPYLSALTSLVEKSPSSSICSKILDLVTGWIFNQGQLFPTLKEKTAVILKMTAFEHRSDTSLFNRYLDLIIRVYEDPKITRSELAIRLESAFLIGTRAPNIDMRNRFMTLFDKHLSRTASKRTLYVLASQSWDMLQDSFWLSQVIELVFGSIETGAAASLSVDDFKVYALPACFSPNSNDSRGVVDIMLEEEFEVFMSSHKRFYAQLGDLRVRHLLEPLCYLQHADSTLAYQIWQAIFPHLWASLAKDERSELQTGMIALLTKDFHNRQMDRRPNCVQALLEGIARTENPRMNFPHHLLKFLARNFNAWYTASCFMECNAFDPIINTAPVRESNLDALAEIYAGLQEDDLFYGLWRKRAHFLDTNTALSYEQHGMWGKAQQMYESATFRARTGGVPFTQGEYMIWEDHWVLCAQKLQQWDILSDFAKNDNLNDLFLDSVWRNLEFWANVDNRKQLDNIVKGVADAPTPRRAFFQTFMSLLRLHTDTESQQSFNRICDESIQLSIRKWHQLPKTITNAHIPILQNFQQLVEVYDASVISSSLSQTTQANLEQRSPELKLLLSTWRDRLPNFWDDINAWQELVTWRQHIFQLINQKYLTLVLQQSNAPGNSLAYRGYHETAWIINRFAQVARKHQLPEVCVTQLSKIYTLPNIEIQEAFLKLREQAKCHYQNDAELQTGLDVINNTNLNYFGQQQKAEFYTLKGMFLAKQKQTDEANGAFGTALYFDLKLPKAWAEWARYNDQLFKENPTDFTKAASAISCYLEAAGTYKNARSRKLLGRILWLLSLDDADGTLAKTFEDFKGETPVWYWITFIPQLLTSLSRSEARVSRSILEKLAKQFPQALYFSLRTSREDMQAIKKTQEAKERAARVRPQTSPPMKQGSPDSRPNTADTRNDLNSRPATANGENGSAGPSNTPKQENSESEQQNGTASTQEAFSAPKQPWEYIEEIVTVLKTASPLLALSLEAMVDQIGRNFKCPPDEDAYRLIVALINDALTYISRSPASYAQNVKLPPATESNITKFAESVLPPHIRKAFEADFVVKMPHLFEYIQKLRKWRDRFEAKLDRRPTHNNLESYGPHLTEFKFHKFVEVEVPGQYLLHKDQNKDHKDQNKDFIRIERFMPDVELTRGVSFCNRKLKIRGHDGSIHSFTIQHPVVRTSRREERMLQMFRFFNDMLARKKESRRRKIQLTLPIIVPLTPNMRMVQDDPSSLTLQGVYEDHCRRRNFSKDEPILFTLSKLKELSPKSSDQVNHIRLQAFEAIQEKWVPPTIVLEFFKCTFPSFTDFWLFRRQFAYQLATLSFLTFTLHMRDRIPSRMSISRATGNIWGWDLVPSMSLQQSHGKTQHNLPTFAGNESVPFRLTPNLQMLLGPIALEGIFSSTMFVIAKALTEPESKLEQLLSLFIRDEIHFFYTAQNRANLTTAQMRSSVLSNGENVMERARALSKPPEGPLPVNQTVIDLVSRAVNPLKLAQMEALYMAYL